ncbi:uncharacterized protein LOC117111250 [Anneissia japonica]|uniref:uncharacterized protein LOC117111250 n=1 Tax=Anneissia japonica TaxID=1529436 RepID=UPI0014259D9D|nr:uncharacterized protein LOC117111250 [Anneissia japonica]
MELTAAVMAARLTDSILRELNIMEVCYWTDSQTVLKYLQSDTRRFKMFVANRVSTLLDLTKVSQWRYVRTADNPADEASRGQGIDDFLRNKRWINGPDFLDQHVEQHINPQECLVEIDENDPEVRKVSNVVVTKNQCCFLDGLISRCSSFMKLRNVVGLVLKFVRRARKNQSKSNDVDQLEAAERFIIVHEQQKHFAAELTALKNGEKKSITAVMKASPLRKLDPMLVDGVIVVGGRLRRAALPDRMKHQIIIPKRSEIAPLIALQAHKNVGHMGRAAMLMYMWEKHWIMGAGALIKGVISKCVICRKYRAKSAEQKMAALPSERVLSDNPVFYNTGLDMFGPFQVKQDRSQVKRYGLLFTCLATRAIHLEIVHTANADSCLNAIRRFVCRRGLISSIRTDNGTNFVAASNELSKAVETWNRSQIPQWLAQHGIRWEFDPPGATHFGGVWERLIRVVRQVMNGVLKEQHLRLDDEGLCTLFCEVDVPYCVIYVNCK